MLRRVRAFVRDCFVSRAARLLWRATTRSGLSIAEKLAALRALHPAAAPPGRIPPTANITLDMPAVARSFAAACSGGAQDRHGWSDDLWAQVLKSEDVQRALQPLLLDILNDQIQDVQELTSGRLSAIPKGAAAIRPIVVGTILLKNLASFVVRSHTEAIATILRPHQLGVACPGGAEHIVHTVRARLLQRPDEVAALVDFTNAFNCVARSQMKLVLEGHASLAQLRGLFNVAYAQPSNLHFGDDVILSQQGCRQGDPLGALLFCLAIHPILVDVARKHPQLLIRAYMDDVTIVGEAKETAAAFGEICTEAAKIGLQANRSKCEWFAANQRHQPRGTRFVDRSTSCIKLLGAYIGADAVAADLLLHEIHAKLEECFSKVRTVDGHEGLLLLRHSLIPRMGYILRTHDPVVSAKAATEFDGFLTDTMEFFTDATLDQRAKIIMGLPTKLGGLGMPPPTLIANAAYTASVAAARIPVDLPLATYNELRQQVPNQNNNTEAIFAAQLQAITATDADCYNLLNDAATPTASAWLRNIPTPLAPMNHAETAAALRLRLGLVHREVPATQCPGCQHQLPTIRFSAHISGCTRITGENSAAGHATLKRDINRIGDHCGVEYDGQEPTDFEVVICPQCRAKLDTQTATLEAHNRQCDVTLEALVTARRQRPDQRYRPTTDNGVAFVIDASMTSNVLAPAGPDGRARRSDNLAMVTQREKIKDQLYKDRVEASGRDIFIPVVVTALGALTRTADRLWQAFADERPHRITLQEVRAAVAFAAVRARAQTVINAEIKLGVKHVFNRLTSLSHPQTAALNTAFLHATRAIIPNDARTAAAATLTPKTTRLTIMQYVRYLTAWPQTRAPPPQLYAGPTEEDPDTNTPPEPSPAATKRKRIWHHIIDYIHHHTTTAIHDWKPTVVRTIKIALLLATPAALHYTAAAGIMLHLVLSITQWLYSILFAPIVASAIETVSYIQLPNVEALLPSQEVVTLTLIITSVTFTTIYLHRCDKLADVLTRLLTTGVPIVIAAYCLYTLGNYILDRITDMPTSIVAKIAGSFTSWFTSFWRSTPPQPPTSSIPRPQLAPGPTSNSTAGWLLDMLTRYYKECKRNRSAVLGQQQ